MPDFTRVIALAYQRILGRPADSGGLENYNQLMNSGMTEADMRESLLRSGEFERKNPGPGPIPSPAATTRAAATRKKKKKKKSSGRKKAARRTA